MCLTPLPLPPSSLPLPLPPSRPGSWNTLFPPSDCMSCWLALPFHAVSLSLSVSVCVQDCSCVFFFFFLRGGMSVLNHMISPSDKPSLCKPQQHGDRGLMSGDDEARGEGWRCTKSSLCRVLIVEVSGGRGGGEERSWQDRDWSVT